MKEPEYDVVIIGAGITGALVAKTLTDKGGDKALRVLILEAGQDTGKTVEGYRSYLKRFYEQVAKVPNSPYPENKNAPSSNVLNFKNISTAPDADGYLVQYGPIPFLSDYERALGGTTLHWMGTCLRMLPNDFKMKSRYGVAVDWPIDYQDLRIYYEHAEREMGVSANVEDQIYPNMGDEYFGNGYQYPMHKIPQSFLDRYLDEHIRGMKVAVKSQTEKVEVSVQSTPQGRNSTPNPDYNNGKGYTPVGMVGDPETGQRCEGNSSCVPICPVQAKYNAIKTLNAIPKHKLDVLPQSVASKILISPDSGRVSGIEYKQYADINSTDHKTKIVRGKVYVLAAHAIENAKLLLASNVANSSDQVGRNLGDNLGMITWGLLPQNIGSYRGPSSSSGIPSFRDGACRRVQAAFRVEIGNWGWLWPANAPISSVDQFVDKNFLFGKSLRQRLAGELPRQFRIAWEAEVLPNSNNRVTIQDNYRDALGNYRPVIHYDVPTYTRAGLAQAKEINNQLFQRLGIEDFTEYKETDPGYYTYENAGYTVNGTGHVVGTHRMGSSRNNSVVNKRQQCWDHENLYLVGCGNMTTTGTSNPTLTAAALAIWAADNILEDLS